MDVLHGSKLYFQGCKRTVCSHTGLDRTYRTAFSWEHYSQSSPNIQSANVLVSRELSDQRVFGFAWKSIWLLTPLNSKEHTAAHSQTRHVDVLGIKYGKVLHLRLDIIIISCGACNLQMFALQSTELDLMTDDSHACKSSLIWSTTALNVSWNETHLVYLYGVGLFPCNN